jgi:Protein kinase domain
MPELPSVGDEFAGYRLRAVLGRGGMSVVFQAENPRLGNVIALKVLAPEVASDDLFRTRFLEESRIAASMNHPNVIPIHDMGSTGGLLYIAMRWVSGTDMRQMIKKHGRLRPEDAVFLLTQAARALDAAHARGLVHRDVKPGNLLVERGNDDADPDHLYLADFGITKRGMTRTGLTSTGQFLGTVDYVAPEQIRGMSALGTADQYSLGCVLYECLTGQVPFEKDLDAAIIWAHVEEPPTLPTVVRPDLPLAVDEVFARVLAKQPADRYGDCREFMAAARAALASPPAPAAPAAPAGRPATRPVGNAAALLAWYAAPPVPAGFPAAAAPADDSAETASDYPAEPAPTRPEPVPAGYSPRPADVYPADPEPIDSTATVAPADHAASAARGYVPEPPPIGYPAEFASGDYLELTHEVAEPSGGATGSTFASSPFARSTGDGTVVSHRRHGEGALPGGADGLGDWPPRRDPGRRRRRRGGFRWLGLAAAVVLIAGAGGAAYAAKSGGTSAKPKGAVPTTKPRASGVATSAMAKTTNSRQAKPSTLMSVLTQADHSSIATGLVPPSSCKQQSSTLVTCTAPAPAIATATFTTYPTLTALYAAYEATVKSLTSGQFKENYNDCGVGATNPFGEVAWNHDEMHPRTYTVAQMAAGQVPFASAAGRMTCVATAHGSEDIVWTTDIGDMLGVAIGKGSAVSVWYWWVPVHHWILFPGTPSMASMNSCSVLMHAATGCSTPASQKPSSSMGPTPSGSPPAADSSPMSP